MACAVYVVMGTANKIPAFRPIQPAKLSAEHEVSAIHAGHGSQVKVAGLNQDQIVHGSRGQNDQNGQRGYSSREFPFPVQLGGESHIANIQGVNTFRNGSMRLNPQMQALIGSSQVMQKPIRAVGIPKDFNQQIATARMSAHIQARPGIELAAFKADPNRFAAAIRV